MIPVYRIRDLVQAYDVQTVLRLDDYTVEPGSITALVGPNGSGKSTLLDLLALVRNPVRGRIEFFGESPTPERRLELHRQIAYLQQKPYLFNMSVAENIELGMQLRKVDVRQRRYRSRESIREFGLEELAARSAHALSGGEIQKVALARTLVMRPRVLLLDEPFTHLDAAFRGHLEELLCRIRGSGAQTLIFTTHDQIQAQRLADHVCNLVDGRLVPSMLVNLFRGRMDDRRQVFDTGKIRIHLPAACTSGNRLAIESTSLVLSNSEFKSSMQNHFFGVVKSLVEEAGNIRVTVDCGETFHAMVTVQALRDLAIGVGSRVCISFKSTAVHIL